jgi:hypothetical protein
MTQDDVTAACTALQAQGRAVTLDTVHAQLGYGSRAMVRLHLTRLQQKAAREALDTETAAALRQYGGRPIDMRTATPDREADAARLDTLIAARKAALPPPRTVPPQEDPGDEDMAPEPKEARRRKADLTLARSLLAEAVPWLGR